MPNIPPPNAKDLLNRSYRPSDPRRRTEVEDFRAQGLLGEDTPYVPQSLRRRSTADKQRIVDFWEESDKFLDDDRSWSGFEYNNNAGAMAVSPGSQGTDTGPAPLTEVPTSTIYPPRPRTVAAGYMEDDVSNKQGKITVVFRDGTYYNYYGVSRQDWFDFRRAYSKGRFIKARLDGKHRGVANMFAADRSQWADDGYMETLYRSARTAQMEQGGIQRGAPGIRQQAKSPTRRQHWHASSWAKKGYKAPSYVGRSKRSPTFNRPY